MRGPFDELGGRRPRSAVTVSGLTLDAGALIAVERGDPSGRALLVRAVQHSLALAVPAGVLGQVWRDGARRDVIDASVVVCARQRGHSVVTSDADDLRRLDPRLPITGV